MALDATAPSSGGGGDGDEAVRPLLPAASDAEAEELDAMYAPYARRDAYGTMGRGELPALRRVELVLRAVLLVPVRFVAGMLLLVAHYLVCRACTLFVDGVAEGRSRLEGWRRVAVVQSGRALARAMLFVFGFYWIRETDRSCSPNAEDIHQDQSEELEIPGAIVSNHVSYIDILYHMSVSFPSFVAKESVSRLPLVGLISKCLGCIFVRRESKGSDSKGVAGAVTERVQEVSQHKNSSRMLLFPEGTTTNGDYLLPFKTGAFLARVPVQPVILRYPYTMFSPAWDSMDGISTLTWRIERCEQEH
ncbi:lysophospholipid acyltransferase LPEAT1-like isoform X2 [Oryza brachyantha]|uniref:lysophospholipid acyltransferase LPEAT1-like isoform X2 n=1 Tax=Oryza brachyantha TaxID=4533 RepID=UPI0007761A7E|nr:lysophospholipid acyltransferase LPEAT1-like isoform X2 [Oryza brachyantha]